MLGTASPVAASTLNSQYLLFKNLNNAELQDIAQYSRLRIRERNQYLCMQDSPSNKVFNVVTGVAMVERISAVGRRQVLGFVFPGDFVGLSNSRFFEYGIRCLSATSVCEFERKELYRLSESIPALKANLKFIRALVQQITFDQLYMLGQMSAYERICFLILELLERLPDATEDYIELPMARADIADYLGLTVETVSRSLYKLKCDSLIETPSAKSLRIVDRAELEAVASVR
ncbi:MAG: helix-turn-helix domain-containing protein [Alteromonadaceae bacterium]|nr:helix-turn-helix domain-containing protein [Alteromonadaceae bacterium]